ncbi:hypothetical protein OBBRIDRAFT_732124 [Obba rivulosa]|uniref:C2H2-type domain-containing protein n=1 Tax=Obba rivulosa TaxID=1052685 RepID=A0A8E2DNF8_9APHY|nr:hypothetical protein OBBRIDRAFT_732124 [Obba rivulosa]
MPEAWKPISFIARRSFASPQEDLADATEAAEVHVEPQSLPSPKYVQNPPQKWIERRRRYDWEFVDGKKHDIHNGVLLPSCWLPRPGPQKVFADEPLPVSGVNKKAKGRHVPTKEMGVRKGTTYTCRVLQCRKVFTRYEHLRRHYVSLHSHDKPHACPLPFCDKAFARLDNLRQHMKVHRDCGTMYDCTKDFDGIECGKLGEVNLDIPKPLEEVPVLCFDPRLILFIHPHFAETGDPLGLFPRPRAQQEDQSNANERDTHASDTNDATSEEFAPAVDVGSDVADESAESSQSLEPSMAVMADVLTLIDDTIHDSATQM